MTQAPPGGAVIPVVTPAPGTRLEQLLAQREAAKAAAEAAQERLTVINDGIRAEAASACPGQQKLRIAGSAHWPALKMSWIVPWRLDSARMRREDPAAWARWAKQGAGYWDLRAADGGGP